MSPEEAAAHAARIEFMEAMGQAHFSRTDAQWHVAQFAKKVGADLDAELKATLLQIDAVTCQRDKEAKSRLAFETQVGNLERDLRESNRLNDAMRAEFAQMVVDKKDLELLIAEWRPVIEAVKRLDRCEAEFEGQGGEYCAEFYDKLWTAVEKLKRQETEKRNHESDLTPQYICPLCYHRRDSEEHKLCEQERAARQRGE